MRITALTAALMLANTAQAMQALDDDALADVSGQAGISLETVSSGWTAGKVSYSQDGKSLDMNNVAVAAIRVLAAPVKPPRPSMWWVIVWWSRANPQRKKPVWRASPWLAAAIALAP